MRPTETKARKQKKMFKATILLLLAVPVIVWGVTIKRKDNE